MKWIEIYLTCVIVRNVRITAHAKLYMAGWDAIRSQRKKKTLNQKQGHDDGTVWQMNEVIKSICESDDYCVPWVDMYHAMGQNGLTRGTLTSDGVHLMSPNGVKRYNDILVGQSNSLGI